MVENFQHMGWLEYFVRLSGFDYEISLEFSQTLHVSIAQVRRIFIIVNDESVVWVMGLETE